MIAPSLPGYGFSGKPTETGWGVDRIAAAFAELMAQLGYDRYFAQGGDWGSAITTALGATEGEGVLPTLYTPVISGDGNTAAWFNRPAFCFELDANSDTGGFIQFPCDAEEQPC